MLDDKWVVLIEDFLEEFFEVPENKLDVWIQKNEKSFNKMISNRTPSATLELTDKCFVFDVVGEYFTNFPWPKLDDTREYRNSFMFKLTKSCERYGWKIRVDTNSFL